MHQMNIVISKGSIRYINKLSASRVKEAIRLLKTMRTGIESDGRHAAKKACKKHLQIIKYLINGAEIRLALLKAKATATHNKR